MRTVSFQSVYEAIVRRHGLDPLGDSITHDTARALCEHITNRCQTAWTMWDWPDLMLTEERAYRAPWNATTQYRRVNADGVPDEVYYLPERQYYRVNPAGPYDPPWAYTPPSVGPDLWTVFTPTTTFIDRDQLGMRPIGQVFGVYGADPSLNGCCTENCIPFRPSEKGVTLCHGPADTVFIEYLLTEPEYTFVPYITYKNQPYVAGDRVFFTGDGNCYRCIAESINNQAPPDPHFWVLEPVPAVFATYLKEGAYADSLIETFVTGEDQIRLARAAAADKKATENIQGLIDDLLEQGQKHYYLKKRWYGVSWHYDGMIQWPTSGWCCTRPWSGNIVHLLTGAPYIPPDTPQPPLVLSQDTGSVQLVSGQGYIDVVFDTPRPNTNWVFIELLISNTVDANPLNIWPGIVTSKTTTGFRLQLNGTPDSNNYNLQWTINEITTAPSPATSYILSGPASGAPGIPATFTVQLPSNTTVPATVVITPSDGGAGGTFSPPSVGLTTAAPSATFTYTAPTAGAKTISATNNAGLTDPASVTFTVAYATTYTLLGPTSGEASTPSTNFTVALVSGTSVPSPVTVTPSAGGGGGTFTPASVTITTGAPSATFTYTPASAGAKTISVTNDGGLTNPTSLTYTAAPHTGLLTNLISYWKLDEASGTRNDSQGTNHLTAINAPVGAAGIINNGAQLVAASSQCLSVLNNASLQVTSDFTFSVWAKLASNPAGGAWVVAKDSGIAGQRDYDIFHHNTVGYVFAVNDPATIAVAVGTPASIGAWTHIVAWWDSADQKLRIRINDSTTVVSSMTGALTQSIADFTISAHGNGAGGLLDFFDGVIDEVGFWKRKLTAAEITQLYNGGAGLPFSSFT